MNHSARRIGHILYAASRLDSDILRIRFRPAIDTEQSFRAAFTDANDLRRLAAYATCVADRLDGLRSDWLGRNDLRRAGSRLLERVRKRGLVGPPRPFSEAELAAIKEGLLPEHQKPRPR